MMGLYHNLNQYHFPIVQWGIYRDGWNNFPINFTNFCVGTSCGEYSFDNRDNWIRFDAGLSGFRAQKLHDILLSAFNFLWQ